MTKPRIVSNSRIPDVFRTFVQPCLISNNEYADWLISTFKKKFLMQFPFARCALYHVFDTFFNPGDEVLVSSYSVPVVVEFLQATGVEIRYIDTKKNDFELDMELLKQKISSKTKGILIAHLYGRLVDCKSLSEICKSKGIFLVEDSAQALYSKLLNTNMTFLSDADIFSTGVYKPFSTFVGGGVLFKEACFMDAVEKNISSKSVPLYMRIYLWLKFWKNLGFLVATTPKLFSVLFLLGKFRRGNYFSKNTFDKKVKNLNCNPKLFLKQQKMLAPTAIELAFEDISILKNKIEAYNKYLELGNRSVLYHYLPVQVRERRKLINLLGNEGYDISPGNFYNFGGNSCINAKNYYENNINLPLHRNISYVDIEKISKIVLPYLIRN